MNLINSKLAKPDIQGERNELDYPMMVDTKVFAEASGIPFFTLKRLMADGRLKYFSLGRRHLIPKIELERLSEILAKP